MSRCYSCRSIAVQLALFVVLVAPEVSARTLKIATIVPDGSSWLVEMRQAGDDSKEKTGGRVKLKFYPGGATGSGAGAAARRGRRRGRWRRTAGGGSARQAAGRRPPPRPPPSPPVRTCAKYFSSRRGASRRAIVSQCACRLFRCFFRS